MDHIGELSQKDGRQIEKVIIMIKFAIQILWMELCSKLQIKVKKSLKNTKDNLEKVEIDKEKLAVTLSVNEKKKWKEPGNAFMEMVESVSGNATGEEN